MTVFGSKSAPPPPPSSRPLRVVDRAPPHPLGHATHAVHAARAQANGLVHQRGAWPGAAANGLVRGRGARPPSPRGARDPASFPTSRARGATAAGAATRCRPARVGPRRASLEVAEATSIAPPHALEPTAVELSLQAEIAALQAALTAAVAETARVRREVLEASVPELVHLAGTIAEQVIGKRLERDPSILAALAREGIDALLEADELTVAVAPDLAERVPPEVWARALEGRATVVVDASMDATRCEVRGKSSRVAVDPRARLRVVLDALDDPALEAPAPSSRSGQGSPREGAR